MRAARLPPGQELPLTDGEVYYADLAGLGPNQLRLTRKEKPIGPGLQGSGGALRSWWAEPAAARRAAAARPRSRSARAESAGLGRVLATAEAIALNTKLDAEKPAAGPVVVKDLQGNQSKIAAPVAVPASVRQQAQRGGHGAGAGGDGLEPRETMRHQVRFELRSQVMPRGERDLSKHVDKLDCRVAPAGQLDRRVECRMCSSGGVQVNQDS